MNSRQISTQNLINFFEKMVPTQRVLNRNREVNPLQFIKIAPKMRKVVSANNLNSHSHMKGNTHWTYEGIHQVYVKMFEKFGWMLLEGSSGNHHRIECYAHKIEKMRNIIQKKAATTKDSNRIQDLHAMYYNLGILLKGVEKL
jgi:hypothetical protein